MYRKWKNKIEQMQNEERPYNVWILCPYCLDLVELDLWGILCVLGPVADALQKERKGVGVFQLDCLCYLPERRVEFVIYEESDYYDESGNPLYMLLPPVFHYRDDGKSLSSLCNAGDQWDLPYDMDNKCITIIRKEKCVYGYIGDFAEQVYGDDIVAEFKKLLRKEGIFVDLLEIV